MPSPGWSLYRTDKEMLREYSRVREIVIERDRGICQECGDRPEWPSVDHITELRFGGSLTDLCNLRVLCHPCHNRKTLLADLEDPLNNIGGWGPKSFQDPPQRYLPKLPWCPHPRESIFVPFGPIPMHGADRICSACGKKLRPYTPDAPKVRPALMQLDNGQVVELVRPSTPKRDRTGRKRQASRERKFLRGLPTTNPAQKVRVLSAGEFDRLRGEPRCACRICQTIPLAMTEMPTLGQFLSPEAFSLIYPEKGPTV